MGLRKSAKRLSAVMVLGPRCNRKPRCLSCYLDPKLDSLEPATAHGIVRKLKGLGHQVSLTGGEVLMKPKYLGCYKTASQTYILSNGTPLIHDPSLFGLLRKHEITEIRFSVNFDMSAELNSVDQEQVERALGMAKERGFQVAIATLITSRNWANVAHYCDEARRLGARAIRFYRFLPMGNAQLGAEYFLPRGQLPAFFDLVRQARKEHDGTLKVIPHLGFGPTPGAREKLAAKGEEYCTAGKKMVAVTADGAVYGCPFLIREGMKLGEITTHMVMLDKGILGNRDYCLAARLYELQTEARKPDGTAQDPPLRSPG